jgi:putative MATE family efflux protein
MKPLVRLAGPIIAFNVLNVSALAVDTALCGMLPNAETLLAGLGFATQLVYLAMVIGTGISVGAVAVIARAHGAGAQDTVNHYLRQALLLTVLLGLGVGVWGSAALPTALRLLGARGAELYAAQQYATPMLYGIVLGYMGTLFAAGMRGVGHSVWPLAVGVMAVLLNVFLDYTLILGKFGLPRWGIAGAAYGTLISRALTALWLGILLLRGSISGIKLRLRPLGWDPTAFRQLAALGMPAALDFMMLNVAYLSVVLMLGHISATAVAAHSVGMRLLVLAFIPALGISQATAALVGQHLGGRRLKELREVVRSSLLLVVLAMGLTSLLLATTRGTLLSGFGVPSFGPLRQLSELWFNVIACILPILGINIIFVGFMQGLGLTRVSLVINLVGTLLVQIPIGLLTTWIMGWGPLAAWLSLPLGFGVRATLGAWIFHTGGPLGHAPWVTSATRSRSHTRPCSRSKRGCHAMQISNPLSNSGGAESARPCSASNH